MILNDGYYISDLIVNKEQHAGGIVIDRYYSFYVFDTKGRYKNFTKTPKNRFDISQKETLELIKNNKDHYRIVEGNLFIKLFTNTKFECERRFSIKSPNLIIDEKGREFHFHPWPEE